jgi:hypothetical protein
MSGIFSSPAPAPPPPPPVQPAPVVYPSKPVQAGQREEEDRKGLKKVRTGVGSQARQPSILGGAGTTETKTLLGQ